MGIPSKNEALALLEEFETPGMAKKHTIEVGRIAVLIGKAFNSAVAAEEQLNINLIEAAGITHDMVRHMEDHGEEAAKILEGLGHSEVAEIVKDHMKYKFEGIKFEEVDIVCLADRLVLDDQFVGVERRMAYVLEKYKHIPEAEEKINKAIKSIKEYVDALENKIGKSLEEVIKAGN